METMVPMADLASEWCVTANTVSRRLSFLGIKPVRQGNFRFITAEQKALADELQNHILSGKPMEAFSRPDGSSSIERQVPRQVSPPVAGQVELIAAVAAAMAQAAPTPPEDPLRRARGLAEAADNGLVLTTDDLVALGVKGVDGFSDGDLAYGYVFSRHRQRNRTLWTIERAIIKSRPDSLLPASSSSNDAPRVGFAATFNSSGMSLFAATTIKG